MHKNVFSTFLADSPFKQVSLWKAGHLKDVMTLFVFMVYAFPLKIYYFYLKELEREGGKNRE